MSWISLMSAVRWIRVVCPARHRARRPPRELRTPRAHPKRGAARARAPDPDLRAHAEAQLGPRRPGHSRRAQWDATAGQLELESASPTTAAEPAPEPDVHVDSDHGLEPSSRLGPLQLSGGAIGYWSRAPYHLVMDLAPLLERERMGRLWKRPPGSRRLGGWSLINLQLPQEPARGGGAMAPRRISRLLSRRSIWVQIFWRDSRCLGDAAVGVA